MRGNLQHRLQPVRIAPETSHALQDLASVDLDFPRPGGLAEASVLHGLARNPERAGAGRLEKRPRRCSLLHPVAAPKLGPGTAPGDDVGDAGLHVGGLHGHLAGRSTHHAIRRSSHPCGLRASSAASAAPSGPPGSVSTIASILRLPGLLGLICVPCVRDLPQLRRRPGSVEHAALMDAAFQAVPEYHACIDADHFVLSAERPAKRFVHKSAHLMELRDGGLIILRVSVILVNAVLGRRSAR